MPTTSTLTEPSGWRLVGAHVIAIAAGIGASLLLGLFIGGLPAGLGFVVTATIALGVGFWLMELFYNRPYRAYRKEKQRIYDEEQERLRKKQLARDARDSAELAELEAQELLYGRALQIKKPRSK